MCQRRRAAVRPPHGGCDFLVDPEIEAPAAPVFWLPGDAPAAVHLIAPVPPVGVASVTLARSGLDERADDTGLLWRRLRDGEVLVGPSDGPADTPIGVLIPLGKDWSVRIAAAERLRSTLIDRTADPPLPSQRRFRIRQALRTIDARRAGATYRELAIHFFGAERVAEESWKTSSLKAQVARLTTYGRTLVSHGYRDLLRGKSR